MGVAQVAPDGRWLDVNHRLCDIVGYTREELLALTFQDITHPDGLDTDLGLVRRMLTDEIQTYAMEKRYLRKGGAVVWVKLTVSLVREPSGEPKYFISVVEDIGGRKRAEEALRESEEKFAAAFRSSPVTLGIATLEGEFVDANPAFCNLSGYAREEIIGQNGTSLGIFSAADRERLLTALDLVGRLFDNTEFTLRHRDGSPREVLLSQQTISFRGVPHRLGTGIDITERKRAEAALRQSEASLAAAQTHAKIGSWKVDLATQAATWSAEMFRVFGRDPALRTPRFAEGVEGIHPEDRESFNANFDQAILNRSDFEQDLRIVQPDGGVR